MEVTELYYNDPKEIRKFKIKSIVFQVLLYLFLVSVAIFILIPFYWMIITSLKTRIEVDLVVPTFFPQEVAWSNYSQVFTQVTLFGRYFLNTIFVSVCTTALVVFTTVTAAFAFARLKFKGKELIFALLLMTMMIPGEMFVITNYMTVSVFKWTETFQALIIPFGVSVFYIFFLRQTFQQIPNELYLAAKVDGIGDFKYLWKIMIPIAMPSIVTIIILGLMGAWNAYIWPQLVANNGPLRMIANGLMVAFTTEFSSEPQLQLAASTLVTLPLFAFFVIFRKYIMRGVSRSGIKG